ncbi:hypothetical protein KZZ08_10105 [Roseovarius mucosus]|uniref:hypothetical protein n=1 Tax=Roseovarius mucosus TaxID=215743 RepID=UPI001C5E3830|nr:hypothetical protein [Roseovarius mucosus]MBW4973974.1 hypothetical protein [Roseovarius mucosus]
MSTMTFRAPDSVTALEQVQRRLGPDALILSNDLIDGQVVIVASDDDPEALIKPAPRLRAVPTSPRVDVVIDEPIDPITPSSSGLMTAAVTAAAPRLPSFLNAHAPKPFDRMLGEAKATAPATVPATATAPETPEAQAPDHKTPEPMAPAPALPDPLILRDRLLSAPRIVLVGTVGAGKSQVALQLALMRLTRTPGLTVEFCFCGTGSHGDGAVLAQKSHLLGMTTLFHTPDTLAAPQAGTVQIVVISGRGSDGTSLAEVALELPEARAALVVPGGLRPERIAALRQRWAERIDSAILSGSEDMPDATTDVAALRAVGLVPLWCASNDRLVEGLRVIEGDSATEPATNDDPAPLAQPMLFRHHGPDAESRS